MEDLTKMNAVRNRHHLLTEESKPEFIRRGFGDIAGDYDLMNDLITFRLHRRWKRLVVRWLGLSAGDRVLDLCTGTGDLAYLCCSGTPAEHVVGLDFSPEMTQVARKRTGWCVPQQRDRRPCLVRADALQLPFPDGLFAAVTVGYGLRNLADMRLAFREIERVLRPGGRLAILDTDRPDGGLMGALHRLYLLWCIPTMAGIIHGSGDMYRYLASSALSFPSPTELATHCATAGLEVVRIQKFLGGASVAVLAVKAK